MASEILPPGRGSAPPATPPGSARSITRVSSSLQDKMIGRMVGQARLLKRLGRGGMGDVYLAAHGELNKTVAIKILPPDLTRNEELIQRFRREAQSAARLEHPNLVEIYDVGEENGFHYITMAYVEGMNLQELMDDAKRLEPREAARIAYEVARGLEAVHAEGIIHRDIKPANILISSRGEVKIVDFGLAFDADDKTTLTIPGAVMGTPWYLSPEQAEGKRADLRSDLYSLGICLYLLVTGVRPFIGETHMSVLYKQIHEKPKDPRLHNPDLPGFLADLILRALEKKPEKRFSTASDMARELDRFLKGNYPAGAPSAPAAGVLERPPGRLFGAPRSAWRVGLGLAATLVIGGGVCLAIFHVGWRARGREMAPAPLPLLFRPAPEGASYDEWVKKAAIAEAKGDLSQAERLYREAAKLRDSAEAREGLARLQAKTKPELSAPPTPEPALFKGLLSDADRRQMAERDYAPVLKRLMDRHTAAAAPAAKLALSRVGQKISSAFRVVTQFRAVIAAEKHPALRLRDGRLSSYAFTPLPALDASSIVEYARRSPEVNELDLAFFLLVDGEGKQALDHVIQGREIRPECRGALEDLVEGALSQARDAHEIVERLFLVKDKLPPVWAARVEAARR
jgi:tRNA A-37 threonylcarbamoyl transferase component Bud32